MHWQNTCEYNTISTQSQIEVEELEEEQGIVSTIAEEGHLEDEV